MELQQMRRLAADIRIDVIRQLEAFGGGHIGGSMSIADTLAVLYGGLMRVDPQKPNWPQRDRLVMSKGHCSPALYAALAECGFFPKEKLLTMNQNGTMLPSHCSRLLTPGVDASAGSLGQGISVACGFAMAARLQNNPCMTYALVGDGEMQEGQVWEAVQFAAHQKLGRFVLIADMNKKQLDGLVDDVCCAFDVPGKFRAFGFEVYQAQGDDVAQIATCLTEICACGDHVRPSVLLLDSVKGCGCNFAEETFDNHWIDFDAAMAQSAIDEIERRLAAGLLPGGGAAI